MHPARFISRLATLARTGDAKLHSAMFGFLAPQRSIPSWRQAYARVCQHQRELFGLSSLPFLSYEAAFAYQLAIDFDFIPRLAEDAAQCCRLRRIAKTDRRTDERAATFAASFGMLLAGIKLQDDVADSGRWYNRVLEWKYRSQVDKAKRLLCRDCPQLMPVIEDCLQQHAALEATRRAVSIEAYGSFTATAFGAVLSNLCTLLNGNPEQQQTLESIGEHLGRAIVTWDCASDFEADQISDQYNPLTSAIEVNRAMDATVLQLSEIGWLLPDGTCAEVVAAVSDRIRRQRNGIGIGEFCTTARLERWGLIRSRKSTYAGCDGCELCCCGGECCECCAGAETCNFCPCECCFHCSEIVKSSKASNLSNGTHSKPESYHQFQSRTGVAVTNLHPSGFVLIEGERVPARAAGATYIQENADVRVVSVDRFGVKVLKVD